MLRDKRERQRLGERGTERRESQKERDRETQNAGCHNGERDPRILLPIWEAAWVREWGCLELYTQGPMSLLSPPPGLSFMPLQIWSKALAVSGILTMGLALLGCVGALKELRCLLGLVSVPSLLHPRTTHIPPQIEPLHPGEGLGLTSPLCPPVFWDTAAPVCHADHPGDPHLHSVDPGELAFPTLLLWRIDSRWMWGGDWKEMGTGTDVMRSIRDGQR